MLLLFLRKDRPSRAPPPCIVSLVVVVWCVACLVDFVLVVCLVVVVSFD